MAFYNWAMANGYQDGLQIDRINVNGNYEPSNCRFTNRTTQTRNVQIIRKNNKTGFKGVSIHRNRFASTITVNSISIHIGIFKTAQDAAVAYDNYVIANGLEHTTNYKKGASL